MIYIAPWKKWFIFALCLCGIWYAMPNAFHSKVEAHNDALTRGEESAAWPSFLPSGLVNLGLDLRGGAHLLAEVSLEEVYTSRVDGMWPQLRDALKELRSDIGSFRRVESAPDQLRVRITNGDAMDKAITAAQGLTSPVVSITANGARDYSVVAEGDVLVMSLSEAEKQATNQRTMEQTLEIIRRRIDEAGTREPVIQRQGERRVLIQVPGIGSAEELKALIGTTAQLGFYHVIRRTSDPDTFADLGTVLLPSGEEEGQYYLLDSAAIFTGENLINAQPSFEQNSGRPIVTFSLDIAGARSFARYTSENIGALMASVLDGEVIQAASINEPILGGNAQISGRFTVAETTRLAVLFRAGALPAELTFIEERTVGPDLGADSIAAGKIASIIALGLVLAYMVLSYGLFGVFAATALVINIILIFAVLSIIGATLTLPGIAGIVLTIGMAVDANVLIFERIREELRVAKGPAKAIDVGYERAMSAIFDANITTFLTAVILFAMGAGPVRGFAVTLGVGIMTSVFTAIFVTRLMIVVWFERTRPKRIEV